MNRMIRRQRLPAWASVILATVAYSLTFLAAIRLPPLLAPLSFSTLKALVAPFPIDYGLLMAAVFGAYFVSRWLYLRVRWQQVSYDGSWCLSCGYNLTGNVSGRCPECGTPT